MREKNTKIYKICFPKSYSTYNRKVTLCHCTYFLRYTLIRKELNFFFCYFTANKSQRVSKFVVTMYLLISTFKHLCIVCDASCIAREIVKRVVQITRVSKRNLTIGLHAETSYSFREYITGTNNYCKLYLSHMHIPTNCCVYSIVEKNDVLHPSIVPALKLKLP